MQSKQPVNKKLSDIKSPGKDVPVQREPSLDELLQKWYLFDDNEDARPPKLVPEFSSEIDFYLDEYMKMAQTYQNARKLLNKPPLATQGFFKTKKQDTYCGFTSGFLIGKEF